MLSVFTLFTLIGVLSGIYDKDFVNIILGEEYVNETIENIKNKCGRSLSERFYLGKYNRDYFQ
jgi:hypothetical protein